MNAAIILKLKHEYPSYGFAKSAPARYMFYDRSLWIYDEATLGL